jgi:rubrerythrin
MTEENVKAAFAGESQAHVKYLNFAEKAAEEGKQNAARLFKAASYSEQVHASNHLRVLEAIASTAENLSDAAAGEKFEVDEMYPAYIVVADDQQEKDARRSFNYAFQTEKAHLEFYDRACEAVKAGGDATIGELWVCNVCGLTMEGEPPDKCPICGNPKANFVKF